MRPWVWRWGAVAAWMAVIFLMSGRTPGQLPDFGALDLLVKKAGHFLAYGVLALLVLRAVGAVPRPWLATLLIVVLYAASDELHQTFVPGRMGTAVDVVIDAAGALTALLLTGRFSRTPARRDPAPPLRP